MSCPRRPLASAEAYTTAMMKSQRSSFIERRGRVDGEQKTTVYQSFDLDPYTLTNANKNANRAYITIYQA